MIKRLLDSARKHFNEKGFLNAQLSDICRDAGVTTGAVYKRYKGKKVYIMMYILLRIGFEKNYQLRYII